MEYFNDLWMLWKYRYGEVMTHHQQTNEILEIRKIRWAKSRGQITESRETIGRNASIIAPRCICRSVRLVIAGATCNVPPIGGRIVCDCIPCCIANKTGRARFPLVSAATGKYVHVRVLQYIECVCAIAGDQCCTHRTARMHPTMHVGASPLAGVNAIGLTPRESTILHLTCLCIHNRYCWFNFWLYVLLTSN